MLSFTEENAHLSDDHHNPNHDNRHPRANVSDEIRYCQNVPYLWHSSWEMRDVSGKAFEHARCHFYGKQYTTAQK